VTSSNYSTRQLTLEDSVDWSETIDSIKDVDFFYLPEYLALFEHMETGTKEDSFCGKAHLFIIGDDEDFIVHPFLLRDLGWTRYQNKSLYGDRASYDVVSPYGYAGPQAKSGNSSASEELWKAFYDAFHKYCLKNGIVTEFTRMHPFTQNSSRAPSEFLRESGFVVYLDLEQSVSEIWESFEQRCRRSIRKAGKQGIKIHSAKKSEDIDSFKRVYDSTMSSHHASKCYFFPLSFYSGLARMKGSALFTATIDDRVVSAGWFVSCGKFSHYFLGGSDPEHRNLGSNSAIMFEAIKWAKSMGCKRFCLGGGYQGSESLLKFKMSFSGKTTAFQTFRRVHDQERYHTICRTMNIDFGAGEYFPAYRDLTQIKPETDTISAAR